MNNNAPKISVIIAVYNCERYLRQCLDSIVNQTLQDIEIICVNDGSTDTSPDILQEYANRDKRIIVITQKNSGGPGGPRNRALDIAKGEFINITDADDYRELNSLENLYLAAKKLNADSAFGDVRNVNANGKAIGSSIDPRIYGTILEAKSLFYNPVHLVQHIFKRELIKHIRYIENTDYEDHPFLAEILMNIHTAVHAKDSFYYYRNLPSSSCSGKTERIFRITAVLDKIKGLLKKYEKNASINDLRIYYRKNAALLAKKAFFTRMPDNASFLNIVKLYLRFYIHLNILKKTGYFVKIAIILIYRALLRLLPKKAAGFITVRRTAFHRHIYLFWGRIKIKTLRHKKVKQYIENKQKRRQ